MKVVHLVNIVQRACNRCNDLFHDMNTETFVWGSQAQGSIDIGENLQGYDAEVGSMGTGLDETVVENRQAAGLCRRFEGLECLHFM